MVVALYDKMLHRGSPRRFEYPIR